MTVTTLTAPDITCEGCASAIRKACTKLPGVHSVDVRVPEKTVTVTHDANVDVPAIRAALERAGFGTN